MSGGLPPRRMIQSIGDFVLSKSGTGAVHVERVSANEVLTVKSMSELQELKVLLDMIDLTDQSTGTLLQQLIDLGHDIETAIKRETKSDSRVEIFVDGGAYHELNRQAVDRRDFRREWGVLQHYDDIWIRRFP